MSCQMIKTSGNGRPWSLFQCRNPHTKTLVGLSGKEGELGLTSL